MQNQSSEYITIQTAINAPLGDIWEKWITPDHITKWYFASDEWHSPSANNDLREGGKFSIRMEAKDGSMGFDLEGEYTQVVKYLMIKYVLADGRKVNTEFISRDDDVVVMQNFQPEKENPEEMQQQGWQAILDNFRKYVEG